MPRAQLGVGRRAGRARRRAASTSPGSTRKPSSPSLDDVGHAADARGDDRAAARERLDRRHRRPLVRRREHEDVEGGEERADVLLVAGEEAVADDRRARARAPRRARGRARRRPCRASRVDAALAQQRERAEDVVGALHAGHPPDPADDEAVVADAHHPARLGPRLLALSDTRALELDPEADDRELRGGGDAERDELVAHLGADRDQRVGDAREASARAAGRRTSRSGRSTRAARGRGTCARRSAGARGRRAAPPTRPTAPAFAVCVCRIVGRSARIIRASRMVASRSRTGEISRCRCGIVTTWTPRLSATYAIDCSPWPTVPATSVVS